MTTLSAGAAAGLLVALMVLSTSDARSAALPDVRKSASAVHPGDARGLNPQPDPPKAVPGDGSVRPEGH